MPSFSALRTGRLLAVFLGVVLYQAGPCAAQDLTGRWCGSWNDCKSGHQGPLRGAFTKCDDNHYRVVFTGKFAKVIPFRFATTLDVTGHDGDKVLLSGQSRVGLFGTFSYSAVATDNNFTANYWSRRYEGQFLLDR